TCSCVTSIGGAENQGPEVAVPLSGGGFSYFPCPIYQNAVVLTFIQLFGNKYNGLYVCVLRRDLT
ncbi:hypothetical protein H4582DRAFT_1827159, partial [Lactarius indigo]